MWIFAKDQVIEIGVAVCMLGILIYAAYLNNNWKNTYLKCCRNYIDPIGLNVDRIDAYRDCMNNRLGNICRPSWDQICFSN